MSTVHARPTVQKECLVPYADLPLDQLRHRTTTAVAPADLAAFWDSTLADARSSASGPSFEQVRPGLRLVDTYDVTFSGFAGDPVKGWLHVPAGASDVPIVVRYQGYGGGRGLAHNVEPFVLAGFAALVMDTRGQGSDWGPGDTPDPHGTGPSYPGFVTRGIESRDTYYYRRLYTDAVLAVDAAKAAPGVDATRIVAAGGSQGGALAIAATSLNPSVGGMLCDVPFLQDVPRGASVAGLGVYAEVNSYLNAHPDREQQTWETLAYVDGTLLAPRITVPSLFSVALMDVICPPSTVFAAYNAAAGPKSIEIYPYSDHVGAWTTHQVAKQIEWLNDHWS
jgi:cephalosporin-C deacetylase